MKNSAKKRKIEEIAEEIEYMGQDSEDKAVKYVQEVDNRNEKEATQEYNDSLNALDMRKSLPSYSQILVEEANSYLSNFDIPKDFTAGVMKTREGLCFWYRSPEGKYFASGNTISLVPEIDMNGVVRKTHRMLDEMERLEEKLTKPEEKSEIITK